MSDLVYRMGTAADIPAMKALWLTVFAEDPPAFVHAFFELLDPDREACCAFSGGQLVSMLFLLPATVCQQQQHLPVRYLYAGCTHPAHRGRGIYGDLLSFAATQAEKMGDKAIYLHPATAHLFSYYARFGYRHGIAFVPRADSPDLPYFEPAAPYAALFSADEDLTEREDDGQCMWLSVDDSGVLENVMRQGAYTSLLGD